ncbi:sugar ABC transporter substrate-binding protein [Roseateles asaccharophilus]|uniref:Multiple sugar transport system substrate-binding protein n=1 Tax=Roseateles asaccharophilus TaxID=582607 RepID=A0ABU2A5L4_9BURK|nr:sugar ABC transporter substrate-binding protein [Roseateles asaccharophilus]MDR7331888.1 multiple sugar transport system substrate-binding protein [Roseateles asaccharophilus]
MNRPSLSNPWRRLRPALLAALAALAPPMAQAQQDVVRVWTRSWADGRKTYDTIAAAFTAKTGIRVEYFNATTDFEQRVSRAAAGGELPDLIINDSGSTGQFVQMGLLAPLDRATVPGGADLHERAWEGAKGFDGKTYGVPTSAQANVLFIRKDWRTRLKLPVPTTWAELEKLAVAFKTQDPDGNGKADTYGFALPGSAQRGYTAWFMSSFIWQGGGEFMRAVAPGQFKATADEAGTIAGVNFVRRLQCELKVTQPGAMTAATTEANKAFISGQAGIYLSGPYHISLFDREPGRDRIEVVPAPAGPGGRAVLAGGEVAYFPKAGKNKAGAMKFVEFLISPEGQTLGMKSTSGGLSVVRLPVNKKIDAAQVHADPRWQIVAQEYAQHGRTQPAVPNWTRMQQLVAEGLNATLSRCGSDVATEMKRLNTRINQELATQKALAKP